MTGKTFFNKIANGKRDILQQFLDILSEQKIDFCIIGGLAVNAYADPVVSLDLDIVIAAENTDRLLRSLPGDFTIRTETHSINISAPGSDLRIQMQTDARYQAFKDLADILRLLETNPEVLATPVGKLASEKTSRL